MRAEGRAVSAGSGRSAKIARRTGIAILVLLVLLVLYYLIGMFIVHDVDDDPDFFSTIEVPEGGSAAVAAAAELIDRELNQNYWVANDPFFLPGVLVDNMPNFQMGIIGALSRFSFELTDHLARVRGSSVADADLEDALGRLNYPGDVWFFEWSSAPVQPSSESQYRRAYRDLVSYNNRLAAGQATYDQRDDNLLTVLDRIAADLGGISASIVEQIEQDRWTWMNDFSDDVFYAAKGRLYGYFIVLSGLEQDFQRTIEQRNLTASWAQMMDSLRRAALLQPLIVWNGDVDGQAIPNHLAGQGLYLLRARTQLREITAILLR